MIDSEMLKKYVALEERRRLNKAEADELQEELSSLEKQLLNQFSLTDMTQARVSDMTVYVERKLFAQVADGDRARAIKALRSAKLNEFVKADFNLNAVSAWIREREAEGRPLPKSMAQAFNVAEVFRLRTRKSR